jgi:hypothetical protein
MMHIAMFDAINPIEERLDAEKFDAILELGDNSGRQFERTPQAFSALTEEGLRDIVLAALTPCSKARPEARLSRGVGKVDIHLRITQGEVLLAELKFWTGPESLREDVQQLRGRLSWVGHACSSKRKSSN